MSRCLGHARACASVGLSQMCVLAVFCLRVQMGPLALVGSTEAGAILMAAGKSPGFWWGTKLSTPPCVRGGFVEKRRSSRDTVLANLGVGESCPTYFFIKLGLS